MYQRSLSCSYSEEGNIAQMLHPLNYVTEIISLFPLIMLLATFNLHPKLLFSILSTLNLLKCFKSPQVYISLQKLESRYKFFCFFWKKYFKFYANYNLKLRRNQGPGMLALVFHTLSLIICEILVIWDALGCKMINSKV